jgi:hypothetical protein
VGSLDICRLTLKFRKAAVTDAMGTDTAVVADDAISRVIQEMSSRNILGAVIYAGYA